MSEQAGENDPVLRRVNRVPLDIVVTATGVRTSGVMVCVLAADLDAYEARLFEMNELAACAAGWFEDVSRQQMDAAVMEGEGQRLYEEANDLWHRTHPLIAEIEAAAEADQAAQSGRNTQVSE